MTEYWKSLEKKYCDMCKCWLNDNRASIQFHENGKRHKENVQLRLREIQKKTRNQDKDEKKAAKNLNKIEKAALEAYNKDKEANPDISLKIQAYEEYIAEQQKKENPTSSTTEVPATGQAKILHRDEKKQKKDELVQEQLAKPLPSYTTRGGWKPMSSSNVSVDLELPNQSADASSNTGEPFKKKSKYEFEEKTVSSTQLQLGSSTFDKTDPGTSITFKKRKFVNSNQRRRESDD